MTAGNDLDLVAVVNGGLYEATANSCFGQRGHRVEAARARAVACRRFVSAAICRQRSLNNSASSCVIRSSAPSTFFSQSFNSGVVNLSALASV